MMGEWEFMDEEFKKEIENAVRYAVDFIKEYGEDRDSLSYPEFLSQFIASKLRERFWFKEKYSHLGLGNYMLLEENDVNPCCIGCFNERGTCGTPCCTCEKIEAFNKKWAADLYLPGKYRVLKTIGDETQ